MACSLLSHLSPNCVRPEQPQSLPNSHLGQALPPEHRANTFKSIRNGPGFLLPCHQLLAPQSARAGRDPRNHRVSPCPSQLRALKPGEGRVLLKVTQQGQEAWSRPSLSMHVTSQRTWGEGRKIGGGWGEEGEEGVCGCSNFFLFKPPSCASQVRLSGKASACKCRRCERCRFDF